MARVTLQTLADRVGVSRMTVSNAFSRPDQLSATLREQILAAAEDLGYVGPDPAARALARGSTGTIGVLLTDTLDYAFTDEIATAFLAAVATALAPTGLAITLLTSSPDQREVIPARDIPMDGALIYSCDVGSAGTGWLLRRKLPVVLVDQVPQPGRASVNIDDRGGARAAAQHLVDLGHRRIAILSASVNGPFGRLEELPAVASQVTHQRLSGWLEVLGAAGITPTVLQQRPYASAAEASVVSQLLESPDPPTAVLCFSDAIALTVIHAIEDAGLRVPQDVSVVGFDDSPLAARSRPPLTTVRQDVAAKGTAAVTALLAQIERAADAPEPAAVLLPTELVVRGSTAPPPVSG